MTLNYGFMYLRDRILSPITRRYMEVVREIEEEVKERNLTGTSSVKFWMQMVVARKWFENCNLMLPSKGSKSLHHQLLHTAPPVRSQMKRCSLTFLNTQLIGATKYRRPTY
jgi:hypothetical protein